MAYPQGSIITKSNMLSDYNSLVITARNNSVVFAITGGGWNPASPATQGNPFFPNNSIGTYTSGDANPLAAPNISTLGAGSLSAVVTASEIYSAFVTQMTAASAIRTVRLIKYLLRTGFPSGNGNINSWDYTQVGSMNSGYQGSYGPGDFPSRPVVGNIIDASDLDSFVSELVSRVNTLRSTTATFNEYYCHSSCHNSCHASRGRR